MALSAHGCRHMWASLSRIADLSRLLDRHPRLNWNYVFEQYAHPDLQRMIFLSLIVAHDLLGAAVPENILQRTKQDSVAVALAQQVRERLFEHKGESRGLRFTYFQLRLRCNWIDRIRYCYRVVWTPTLLEWNVALPGFLFPLYFVLRPIRLARKYLSQLISEKL